MLLFLSVELPTRARVCLLYWFRNSVCRELLRGNSWNSYVNATTCDYDAVCIFIGEKMGEKKTERHRLFLPTPHLHLKSPTDVFRHWCELQTVCSFTSLINLSLQNSCWGFSCSSVCQISAQSLIKRWQRRKCHFSFSPDKVDPKMLSSLLKIICRAALCHSIHREPLWGAQMETVRGSSRPTPVTFFFFFKSPPFSWSGERFS